nr:CD48 antigen-like [Misgurnus anguillicaudatus]
MDVQHHKGKRPVSSTALGLKEGRWKHDQNKVSLLWLFGRVDGDEVKSVSVMEGDSVTLHTDITQIQKNIQFLWTFDQNRLAEIITRDQINSEFVSEDGIFRDHLQMNNQTGSLTITNIRTEHTGLYKLQIIRDKISSTSFTVIVYAPLPVPVITRDSSQCSSSSSTSNCSLLCSMLNVRDVRLSWYKGNSLLSSISVSDLNIRLSLPLEVDNQDTNTYRCVLNNPITNQTQHLNITHLCQTCSDVFGD